MSTDTMFSPAEFPALGNVEEERARTAGNARGHAAGYAAGMRVAAAELEQLRTVLEAEHAELLRRGQHRIDGVVRALNGAVGALESRLAPVVAQAEETLAYASFELAEAIVGYELRDLENSARAAVARALTGFDPTEIQRVRMHPADLALLDTGILDDAGVEFVGDATLNRGDAMTEGADGYLDARIETALRRAKAALAVGPLR